MFGMEFYVQQCQLVAGDCKLEKEIEKKRYLSESKFFSLFQKKSKFFHLSTFYLVSTNKP